ncbi:hypothetical protein QBC37DRAFT_462179, partial [Rhypophila decipiens]
CNTCPASYGSEYTGTAGCASRTHLDQVVFVRQRFADESKRQNATCYEVLCDEAMDLTALCDYHKQKGSSASGPSNFPHCCFETMAGSQTPYFCLSIGKTVDDLYYPGRRRWWLLLRKTTGEEGTFQRVALGYFQYLRRRFTLFPASMVLKSISPV